MYKIGELSKLCRLPVKTLRFYDSEGLLVPDQIDRFTGYRYYSAAKLADCYAIIALKELGFSLNEIRQQLRSSSPAEIVAMITAKETELKSSIAEAEACLTRLESIRKSIEVGESKMFNIVIRGADSIRAATLRRIFAEKSDAINEVRRMRALLPKSIVGPRTIVINYETEYRENNFDLSTAVEITGKLPENCPYNEKIIEFTGDTASLACRADELECAYRAITQRLDEEHCQIVGAFYEIYHEDGTVELKVPVCRLTEANVFQTDNINLPFENDPEAIGKWEMIDIVPSEEQFLYNHGKCGHRAWLHELYFLENGESYWAVDGWTKGWLYTCGEYPQRKCKNRYTIKRQEGHILMFLEMKHYLDGKGISSGMPEIWVYEKKSGKAFHSTDIRLRDNIDYPFIPDECVIGTWKVRDFYVNKPDTLSPDMQNWPKENLFFLQVEFSTDGKCIHTTKNGSSMLSWTKGLLLDKHSETASAYEIKIFDGKEYLFIEWKSGDYTFGGGRIYWYIFTKAF